MKSLSNVQNSEKVSNSIISKIAIVSRGGLSLSHIFYLRTDIAVDPKLFF